jgi:branched-chain amino acid transport system permease protein
MGLTITIAAVTGLGIGAIYGLVALGFLIGYNTSRVFNLAHGDLVMVGVMISWYLDSVARFPMVAVFFVTVLCVVALAVVEERLVIRPFLRYGPANLSWFITTLAFSLIVETVVTDLYGEQPYHQIPNLLDFQSVTIGSVPIGSQYIVAVCALMIVSAAVGLFYSRTWLGRAMRGCADDREIAMLRGIDPGRMSLYGFAISGLIAGIVGFVVGPIVSSDPSFGLSYTVKVFIVLAIGGFGSIRGALVGALILGEGEQIFGRFYSGNYELLVDIVILAAVLLVKPSGLYRQGAVRRI